MTIWRYRHHALLILVILSYLSVATAGFNEPFHRAADVVGWNAAEANVIRNMFEHGTFMPYGNGWLPELTRFENGLYLHQPQLYYYVMYAYYRVVGISERTVRSSMLIVDIASVLLLYHLVSTLWSPPVAILAVFGFLHNIPWVLLGMSNSSLMFVMPFVLATIAVYLAARRRRSWKWWWASVACMGSALGIHWWSYFVPFVIALLEWTYRGMPHRKRRAAVWFFLPFAFFVEHMLFNFLVIGNLREFWWTVAHRSGLASHWIFLGCGKDLTLNLLKCWSPAILAFVPLALVWWRCGRDSLDAGKFLLIAAFPACWLGFCFVMPASMITEKWYSNSMIVPSIAICFAVGSWFLLRPVWPVYALILAAGHLHVANGRLPADQGLWETKPREPVAVGKMLERLTPEGAVIFEDGAGKRLFAYYAPHRFYSDTVPFVVPEWVNRPPILWIDHIARKLRPDRPMFVLVRIERMPRWLDPAEFPLWGYHLEHLADESGFRLYRMTRKAQ